MHRIVLAGGGTAGHVNPLLAVANAIRAKDPSADIAVIGTAVGLERDLVPQAGFELETIEKVPFPRRPNMWNVIRPRWWWVSADTPPPRCTRRRMPCGSRF